MQLVSGYCKIYSCLCFNKKLKPKPNSTQRITSGRMGEQDEHKQQDAVMLPGILYLGTNCSNTNSAANTLSEAVYP